MKISIASLLVVVTPKKRQLDTTGLPGGHPLKRLEKLNQDVENHLTTWFSQGAPIANYFSRDFSDAVLKLD